jgi:HJR/Mrr/RecB family endonuclease
MNLEKPIGYINWQEYYYNIKVTKELIYKAEIKIMEEIKFYEDTTRKRKISLIEEEIIQQNEVSKRIKSAKQNNGKDYEQALYKAMNEASLKPIKTSGKDRGIDVIGEYKGVTIYAQAKDWQSKVSAEIIQQLEGVLLGKSSCLGVMVSRNGYTKEAISYAKASSATILLTNLETVINSISQTIEQLKSQRLSRVEVIGQSAEITHITDSNTKKTIIRNAKKVTMYNL